MATKNQSKAKSDPKQDEMTFTLIKSGKAEKLSPRHPGTINYEITKLDDGLAIRITENSSGGFFSREFIPLDAIAGELDKIESDKPIKSGLLRDLFKSGSSNNAGFLCAALRAEGVLIPAPESLYQHFKGHPVSDWIKAFSEGASSKAKAAKKAPVRKSKPEAATSDGSLFADNKEAT